MKKKIIEAEPQPYDIASTYTELQRAHEYSNEELYPLSRLEALGTFWMEEETNPARSPRSQAEAKRITTLLSFECAWRTGRIQTLIDFYGGQDE